MNPNVRHWLLGAVAAASVFVTGCQSMPSSWSDQVGASIDSNMNTAKRAEARSVPSDVSKDLMPPIEITVPDGKKTAVEPRFDLSVSNAPARQVFMGLVEGTPYDMVLQPDVSGTVTLSLKDVTVPEALKTLRDVYGYEYRRDGNRFLIYGRDMQTRLFNVNYLNLVRKGKSDTRVTASGLSSTGTVAGGSASGAGTSTTTSQSGVQVETDSQADFWKDLQTTLMALVGSDNGRKVIVNPQTGIVAVRALPSELRLVEDYLGATHASVNRQVVLEAKIIEVTLNDGFQAGINWSKVGNKYTLGQVGGGSALNGTGTPGVSETAGNTGNLNPSTGVFSPISGTNASAFGGIFSLAVKSNNFAAFVELLKSQGDVQVLSSPRVSTINNQKAVIKVGTDEFFVIKQDISLAAIAGTSTVTTDLAPFFSGIALDVTPQIDESGNINLHIHPSVSDVSTKTISTGATTPLSTARSSVQESDNIVRAASGQIIVIGGLMKEASTDENASVPLLGDIPIVGNLFKQRRIARVKRELVILLKPTIVNTGTEWAGEVQDSQDRVKRIRIGS